MNELLEVKIRNAFIRHAKQIPLELPELYTFNENLSIDEQIEKDIQIIQAYNENRPSYSLREKDLDNFIRDLAPLLRK